MPVSGRELILAAGGDLRPGEGVKGFLRRVAQDTGIGFRSLERAWKGQYESKNTIFKLQQKAADNAQKLATRLDAIATAAEMRGHDRSDVDALRNIARRLGDIDRRARKLDRGKE
jgi:hypothetical protein